MKKTIIALSIIGLISITSLPHQANAVTEPACNYNLAIAISHSYGVGTGIKLQKQADALIIANLNAQIATLQAQLKK